MPVLALLKMLLPGLAPLLVYVVASEVWGDLIGLWVGVGLGVAEFLFLLLVRRKLDGFVAIDTALLVAMGLISVGLADDVFFRLKPVLTEVLLVGLLGYSAFGPQNLLLGLAFRGETGERLRQAMEAQPQAADAMRRRLGWLTLVFAAHTLLSLASALWMSKEAWAFITGVLPYVLIGAVFLVQILAARFRRSSSPASPRAAGRPAAGRSQTGPE
jgi:intracellular septation protein A